jgi:hypothetical protein
MSTTANHIMEGAIYIIYTIKCKKPSNNITKPFKLILSIHQPIKTEHFIIKVLKKIFKKLYPITIKLFNLIQMIQMLILKGETSIKIIKKTLIRHF